MIEKIPVRKTKVSRSDAEQWLVILAIYGNHSFKNQLRSFPEVKKFLHDHGHSFEDVINNIVNPPHRIPGEFINWIEPTPITVCGDGLTLTTGSASKKGHGKLVQSSCFALWKESHRNFQNCIDKRSYEPILSSIAIGMAAIEAFFNEVKEKYNLENPGEKLIDTKDNPTSLIQKIKKWPKIITGTKLDCSSAEFQSFLKLKEIRDNEIIHSKKPGYSVSISEFVEKLNHYRFGICRFFARIRIHFNYEVYYWLAEAAYGPGVEIGEFNYPIPKK